MTSELLLNNFQELPSKITDPAKSDVDICIVADGVNATVAENSAADENAEPRKHFPTTCSPYLTGVRFGCKDLSAFCKCAAVRDCSAVATNLPEWPRYANFGLNASTPGVPCRVEQETSRGVAIHVRGG